MKRKILFSLLIIFVLIGGTTTYLLWKPTHFTSVSHSGTEVKCERGYIQVSEVRNDSESDKIWIEYVILKSTSNTPKTPIFFLAGGPGDRASTQATNPGSLQHWVNYLPERDVVLIDQRGVGKIPMYWVSLRKPEKDFLVSDEKAMAHYRKMSRKAVPSFERRGINLSAYNSIESAADIDDVRALLGYEKIIPLGFSYGTHLGLTYLKYFESRVESIVLAGCEGLNQTFKLPSDLDRHFDMISELVAQDTFYNKHIPDLQELYLRVLDNLEREPIRLTVKNPIGLKRELLIGKFGLNYVLKRDLGDANDIPFFPRMLFEMDKGNYNIFQQFIQKRYREFIAIPAMTISMDLSSGASDERLQRILKEEKVSPFGKIANAPFLDIQDEWPIEDLGLEFRTPVKTDVPTLLLSGSLDINTPAYQADSIARYFSNSTHLIVENAGHEQILGCWDTPGSINKFINGADVSQDSLKYPELKFIPLF